MEFILGIQLKIYREKSGLSQSQLAAKLNISQQAVSKWENGKTFPDIQNLILLSNIFQITLDELVMVSKI